MKRAEVKLCGPVSWSYAALPKCGRCKIDNQILRLEVSFTARGTTSVVPDVLAIEKWIKDTLDTPTTVEAFALQAAEHWGMSVSVVGRTDTHGAITCVVE